LKKKDSEMDVEMPITKKPSLISNIKEEDKQKEEKEKEEKEKEKEKEKE